MHTTKTRRVALYLLTGATALAVPVAARADGVPASCAQAIPARAANAKTGSQFMESIQGFDEKTNKSKREQAAFAELIAGNIPSFVRKFVEVKISSGTHSASFYVSPDVLSIGSDDNFMRIPLRPGTAQVVHDRFGTTFVTTKLSDEIFKQAKVKLSPITQRAWTKDPPGPPMESNEFYAKHNEMIEAGLKGKARELLTAGLKKDLVLSVRLNKDPETGHQGKKSVVIYGWHQSSGKPIQNENDAHGNYYVDYSHGIRLVCKSAVVDGKPTTVDAVLRDPELAKLLMTDADVADAAFPAPTRYPDDAINQQRLGAH